MRLEWSKCNATCGDNGYQYQTYTCEREDGKGNFEEVSLDMCDFLPHPVYTQRCNQKPCTKFKWVSTEEWSECSESCGDNGIKTKIYKCVDENLAHVDDDKCKGLFQPEAAMPCNRKICVREWYRLESTNKWSECSSSCGWEGLATRIYECKKVNSNDEVEVVDVDLCDSYKGDKEMKPCNRKACDKGQYDWVQLSDWSACSAPCGDSGLQYQEYGCFAIVSSFNMQPVNDSLCNKTHGGNITRECNRKPCFTYQWMESTWGPCSETCGDDGVQEQLYVCERTYPNGSLEAVGNTFCSAITKLNNMQSCNRKDCFEYQWVMSSAWTECSTPCGSDGIQFQMYSCYIVYPNETLISADDNLMCSELDVPNISRECNRIECVSYQWSEVFDWSACTQTCGDSGTQEKLRVCEKVSLDGSIAPVSSSLCSHLSNVSETRPCNRDPCPEIYTYKLRYTNVSECSATCGNSGVRRYNVACQRTDSNRRKEYVDMVNCKGQSLPQHNMPCKRMRCPTVYEWKFTNWSKVWYMVLQCRLFFLTIKQFCL